MGIRSDTNACEHGLHDRCMKSWCTCPCHDKCDWEAAGGGYCPLAYGHDGDHAWIYDDEVDR